MAHQWLYCYPFDKEGEPVLTFGEAVAAARILEAQLSTLMDRWRWPELTLRIIDRHAGYVRYEVERNGRFVGYATVMPFSVDTPKIDAHPAPEHRTSESDQRKSGT